MDPSFEQASQFLDQALLSYAGGQIEEASRYMARAAATLHEIQLAPATPKSDLAANEPVDLALLLVTVHEPPLLPAAREQPAPAAMQPVNAEPARESSLAVAA